MNKRSTSKPPIAIIAPHPIHGGGVLSLLKIAYEFCELYFSPKVYCLSFLPDTAMSMRFLKFTSSAREQTYHGMRCVEIGARWARWEPGHYWFTRRLWKRHLEPYQYVFALGGTPHVAHPAVILDKTFILWLASTYLDDRAHRLAQATIIERLMERAQAPFMEAIERQVLTKARVILPISSYTQSLCEKAIQGKFDALRVCPVPVPVRRAHVVSPGKTLRIIAVARFTDPRKNLKMLLAVCEKMLEDDPRFGCDIVGIYPAKDVDVLRLSTKFAGRIVFHGFIDQASLDELYAGAFVALITSEQEGLGIAGLDALSWGIPVIATHCGGVSDYVIPGLSGFLVEPGAVREMVEYIKLLVHDAALYDWLCKGALSTVQSRFSKKAVFIKLQWALMRAYPELENVFKRIDALEVGREGFGRGACIPTVDQSREVDGL